MKSESAVASPGVVGWKSIFTALSPRGISG
jgi:hypothetical protein